MNTKTRQEIESAVGKAMTKFLKEQLGEQAEAAVVQVVEGAIIVRFKGVLPPAERCLVKDKEGMKLIKELKDKLIEKVRPFLEEMIRDLIDAEVVDIHSSFDPASGERVAIFMLDKNVEKSGR